MGKYRTSRGNSPSIEAFADDAYTRGPGASRSSPRGGHRERGGPTAAGADPEAVRVVTGRACSSAPAMETPEGTEDIDNILRVTGYS